jgi:hypothetical protein
MINTQYHFGDQLFYTLSDACSIGIRRRHTALEIQESLLSSLEPFTYSSLKLNCIATLETINVKNVYISRIYQYIFRLQAKFKQQPSLLAEKLSSKYMILKKDAEKDNPTVDLDDFLPTNILGTISINGQPADSIQNVDKQNYNKKCKSTIKRLSKFWGLNKEKLFNPLNS